MTPETFISDLRAYLPRIVKEFIERAGYELDAYIEKFIDDRGPRPGTRSQSDRWGKQTGRASRGFIPGQAENISEFRVESGRAIYDYGNRVPYVKHLEDGTDYMQARPAMAPGFKAYERDGLPRLLEELMARIVERYNGRA
jgi:hypothetical protein